MVSANVLPCCTRCIPSSNQHCNYKNILPESRFPKAMQEGFYPGTAQMLCNYIPLIPQLAITIITSCIAMVYTNFADDGKIFGKLQRQPLPSRLICFRFSKSTHRFFGYRSPRTRLLSLVLFADLALALQTCGRRACCYCCHHPSLCS